MSGQTEADAVGHQIIHVVRLLRAVEAAVATRPTRTSDERLDAVREHLRDATAEQREAWTARLGGDGARDQIGPAPATTDDAASSDPPGSAGAALEELVAALAATAAGYVRLYTTARLMFDAATCDLAAEHLRASVDALRAINWLLPDVVGRELSDAQGLTCRCTCPACSMGACLCVRNSTDTVLHAWDAGTLFGTRGLPANDDARTRLERWSLGSLAPDRGVALASAPRPGSPLAAAGMQRKDRILAVDGVDVNSNPEIQDALSAHDPGQDVPMKVERASGDVTEVLVRRPEG